MVFSSLTFIYGFLPLTLLCYFLARSMNLKNAVLIVASLLFYAWGEPIWISLLLISSVTDYYHGLVIEKHRGKWQSKAGLISSLCVNLGLLAFFKYEGFFAANINALIGTQIPIHDFGLPIGISFYSFQTLSYVLDVYRGEVPAQKSMPKLLLYVSMFPQLVAGPIVRYQDIAEDIEDRKLSYENMSYGFNRFFIGLFKKVVVANTAAKMVDIFFEGGVSELTVVGAWIGTLAFALQIYFDFSGYSDMAIGMGKMLGFRFKENFNYPYISKSISEFWRRWHISLGSFFRDYVYIPLGGNRKHLIRNLFVVWFLTGLWHGASWNFVLWGVYFGILIALERWFLGKILEKLPSFVQLFYAFILVLIGWVFFYFTDLSHGIDVLKTMFFLNGASVFNAETRLHLLKYVYFIVFALVLSTPLLKNLMKRGLARFTKTDEIKDFNHTLSPVLNLVILFVTTAFLVGNSFNPFLYFRF